ncbi:MAG: hypothetical protein ACK5LN_03820 [Propioniciclava sp.]
MQIDNMVSLSAAGKMGADTWSAARLNEFSNDEDNLVAVDKSENNATGDSTLGGRAATQRWLPL